MGTQAYTLDLMPTGSIYFSHFDEIILFTGIYLQRNKVTHSQLRHAHIQGQTNATLYVILCIPVSFPKPSELCDNDCWILYFVKVEI